MKRETIFTRHTDQKQHSERNTSSSSLTAVQKEYGSLNYDMIFAFDSLHCLLDYDINISNRQCNLAQISIDLADPHP